MKVGEFVWWFWAVAYLIVAVLMAFDKLTMDKPMIILHMINIFGLAMTLALYERGWFK